MTCFLQHTKQEGFTYMYPIDVVALVSGCVYMHTVCSLDSFTLAKARPVGINAQPTLSASESSWAC